MVVCTGVICFLIASEMYGISDSMAEYEAQQEEQRIGDNKEIIDYSKGEKVNIGEEV